MVCFSCNTERSWKRDSSLGVGFFLKDSNWLVSAFSSGGLLRVGHLPLPPWVVHFFFKDNGLMVKAVSSPVVDCFLKANGSLKRKWFLFSVDLLLKGQWFLQDGYFLFRGVLLLQCRWLLEKGLLLSSRLSLKRLLSESGFSSEEVVFCSTRDFSYRTSSSEWYLFFKDDNGLVKVASSVLAFFLTFWSSIKEESSSLAWHPARPTPPQARLFSDLNIFFKDNVLLVMAASRFYASSQKSLAVHHCHSSSARTVASSEDITSWFVHLFEDVSSLRTASSEVGSSLQNEWLFENRCFLSIGCLGAGRHIRVSRLSIMFGTMVVETIIGESSATSAKGNNVWVRRM